MNWALVFKYLSIVLTPIVFISSVFAVAWFYLHQQRGNALIELTTDADIINHVKEKNNSNKVSSNISSNRNENYNRTLLKILDSKDNTVIKNKNISPTIKPAISQESSTINIETQDQINNLKKKLNQKIESKSINNGTNMNKFVSPLKPYNNMAIDNDTRCQNMLKIINGPLENTTVENNNNDNKTSQRTTSLTDVGNSIEKNNDSVHIDRIQQKLQQTLSSAAESTQISNNASVIMRSTNNNLNKNSSQIYEQERTLVRDSNIGNTTTSIEKELNSLDQNDELRKSPAVNSNFENSSKREGNELDIFETTTATKNIKSDGFNSKQIQDNNLSKLPMSDNNSENSTKVHKSAVLVINKTVNHTQSDKIKIISASNNKTGNSAIESNELRKSPAALNNNIKKLTKNYANELDIPETTTSSSIKQAQNNNLNKLPRSASSFEISIKDNKSDAIVINKSVNQTHSNKIEKMLTSNNKTGNSAIENNELRKSSAALNTNIEKSTKNDGIELDTFETSILSGNIDSNTFISCNTLNSENLIKDNKSEALVIIPLVNNDSKVTFDSNRTQSNEIGILLTFNDNTDKSARIHKNESETLVIIAPMNNNSNDTFRSSNQTQSTKLRIQSAKKNDTEIITNDRVNETNNLNITTTTTDDIRTTTPYSDQTDAENEAENEMRCYSQLGCLNIQDSWYHLMHRPINVFPMSREFINTSFILYTNNNPIKGEVLTAGEDKSTKLYNFDPKRKTKFIIHGFNSSPRIPWVNEMRDELFKHDNYNIFIVDWATGSSLALSYTYAAANTRLVGLEIAHLIRYLNENKRLKMSDVHLIGHSLGAHTAGYAGEDLQGQIGRISGLDPAKPDFEYMPSHVRLDPTDARLVDVIHTDSESISRLGIYHPCGHLDFYPNNGDEQPGCSSSFFKTICDHVRAIKIFIESINSECQFIAHECRSYEKYLAGGCFPSASKNNSLGYGIMGYHADKSPALVQKLSIGKPAIGSLIGSKFFISTGDKNPYCRRHYKITIKLANPDEAKSRVQGLMNITLHTDNGIFYNINLTPNESRIILTHGGTTKILAIHPEADANVMGKIRKVDLSWTYNSNTFLLYCFFCNDRLYVDNIVVDVIRVPSDRGKRKTDFSSKFCSTQGPQNYTEIMSGSSAAFIDNCH